MIVLRFHESCGTRSVVSSTPRSSGSQPHPWRRRSTASCLPRLVGAIHGGTNADPDGARVIPSRGVPSRTANPDRYMFLICNDAASSSAVSGPAQVLTIGCRVEAVRNRGFSTGVDRVRAILAGFSRDGSSTQKSNQGQPDDTRQTSHPSHCLAHQPLAKRGAFALPPPPSSGISPEGALEMEISCCVQTTKSEASCCHIVTEAPPSSSTVACCATFRCLPLQTVSDWRSSLVRLGTVIARGAVLQ